MRTFLLVLCTLVVLIGGFFVYWAFQPSFPWHGKTETGPVTLPDRPEGGDQVGAGKIAWVKSYDKTGRLASQFRAATYDPQAGGVWHMTQPSAEIFMAGGQILRIDGHDGDVHMPPGSSPDTGRSAPPSRGTLNDVTLRLYASVTMEDKNQPDLTIVVPNLAFDNDTFELYTEGYTDPQTGKKITADEVPVVMTGQYEFEGTGLTLYWNELDQQLRSMEIAHGKRLLIKHVASPKTTDRKLSNASPRIGLSQPAAAAAGPAAMTQAPPASQPSTSKAQVYRATFNDAVRIVQEQQQLAHADAMSIDFAPKTEGENPAGPAGPAAEPLSSVPRASDGAADSKTIAPAPSVKSSTAIPTTKPDEQPVEILWTGKLTIVPIPAPGVKLDPGQAIVRLTGAPVNVHRQGDKPGEAVDVRCAALNYRTADGRVVLRGQDGEPVLLKQVRPDHSGATVITDWLEYTRGQSAVLHGAGKANLPEPSDPASVLVAAWDKSCTLHLRPGAGGSFDVERADLDGDVTIDHPKLKQKSDRLSLLFDPDSKPASTATRAKGEPSLSFKQMIASGNVRCDLTGEDGKTKSIDTDHLTLSAVPGAGGKTLVREVTADGRVFAKADEQSLKSNHLDALLKPSTRPSKPAKSAGAIDSGGVDLDRLIATGDVLVTGKDGASAEGDRLDVNMIGDQPDITITGAPATGGAAATPATVKDKDSVLGGQTIHVSPKDQTAVIDGPGTLDALQRSSPTAKPKRVHVRWNDGATLDSNRNEILVRGGVMADSSEASGARNTAKAQNVVLTLVSKPTTKPVDSKNESKKSNGESPLASTQFDFMKDKEVRTISFRDQADLESVLKDAAGAVVHQFALFADRVDYELPTKVLTVPGPGRMFVEDHKGAGKPDASKASDATGGRGSTAFGWTGDLVYDELNRRAVIEREVHIVHDSDEAKPQRMELWADKVTSTFEPDETSGKAPATQPSGEEAEKLRVKDVLAEGSVRIRMKGTTIDQATSVDYNPANDLLIAKGTDRQPVQVTSADGRKSTTFREVWFNTRTNTMEKMIDMDADVRK